MKPTRLAAHDGSNWRYRFVKRIRSECGRPALCVFESDDLGRVVATDTEVIRRWHRIEEPRPRG